MANDFKNAGVELINADTFYAVYQCDSGLKSAVIHALYISNKSVTTDINAEVVVYDDDKAKEWTIGQNIPIPVGSTLVLDKPLNLEPLDELRVKVDDANIGEVFASILETPNP